MDQRFVLFFFSSRRRHTRLQGDWSSDVCSSDLGRARGGDRRHRGRGLRAREGRGHRARSGSVRAVPGRHVRVQEERGGVEVGGGQIGRGSGRGRGENSGVGGSLKKKKKNNKGKK